MSALDRRGTWTFAIERQLKRILTREERTAELLTVTTDAYNAGVRDAMASWAAEREQLRLQVEALERRRLEAVTHRAVA